MRFLASEIKKPGMGAATYGAVRALEAGGDSSTSPVLVGSAMFIGSVITAGIALTAVTVASPAIVGISAAMAIAVVPSIGVIAGLYSTGQISKYTFNSTNALLTGIGSPEGLLTIASSLSAGTSLSGALNHAKSVSAVRSVIEGISSFRSVKSFNDGYDVSAGIGSAVELVSGVLTTSTDTNVAAERSAGGAPYRFSERNQNDRGVSFGERAIERQAAREASARERSNITSTQIKAEGRFNVKSDTKAGRGESRVNSNNVKSDGTKRGGTKTDSGRGSPKMGTSLKMSTLG